MPVRMPTRIPDEGNGNQQIDAGDNNYGTSPADPTDEQVDTRKGERPGKPGD